MNLQPKQDFSVSLFPNFSSSDFLDFIFLSITSLIMTLPYSHNVYNHLEYHDDPRNPCMVERSPYNILCIS